MAIGRIPDNILEDILSRVDIVEVVSGYIPLKRAGRNYRASCPFHHEKTPSFMVSPDRQIYHCFGCHAGGNAFNFLMQYERLEFPEAVEILAKKAGVVLPESKPQDPKAAGLTTQLYKINESALYFYEHTLNSQGGLKAKDYLLKRGIKESTIRSLKLGYAPSGWDGLMGYARNKGFNLSLLEKAGLILPKAGGGYYDRFRDRIIFPIFDIKSRALAFGARLLPDSPGRTGAAAQAKYVNSPETPIYVKGRNLYGLNFAKDAIRDNDYVVVVEGYLDFALPFQEGQQNIVASLGTALTSEQARLIKRYTSNVVMVYDADDAGQMAALRSLDIFIEEDMNVKVVSLPEGFDPDTFVRRHGIAEFSERVRQAQGLFDYKLKILKSRHNAREIEAKRVISDEMLVTINKLKDAVLRSEYIKKLSQELDISEDALWEKANKAKGAKSYADNDKGARAKQAPDINPTEKLLLKLMLEEGELIRDIRDRIEPADFQDERTSRIVSIMFNLTERGKEIEPNKLINYLNDDNIARIICESTLLPEIPQQSRDGIVDDCIARLKSSRLKARKQRLHEQIKAAQESGDEDNLHRLMQEFHCLTKER
jgi:DNA primase